jgi:large subunit ribosomal protein L13
MADYVIDCKGKVLGRTASEIALILQGKKNASYNPRLEGGDGVIVKNVDKLVLTGRKTEQKIYYSHTTQIGHLKERKFKDVVAKHGMGWVLRKSVLRMLPKNKLRVARIKKLVIEK